MKTVTFPTRLGILNTTACAAVVEMVRFFSVEEHFLLTVTVP